MYGVNHFRFYSTGAKKFYKQGVDIVLNVETVVRQDLEEKIKFWLGQGLYYESVVVTEEKKTTTAACTFTCIEDSVVVKIGV